MSSYSTFFRLGLSLASEPKDSYNCTSYPSPLLPLPPTPTPTSAIAATTRPITRRRRSSLTISIKSTRVATKPEVELIGVVNVVSVVAGAQSENIPPQVMAQTQSTNSGAGAGAGAGTKKLRRKTITSQAPILLTIHQHTIPTPQQPLSLPPLRFPPPTTPLPPTPLSPSFSTWSQKKKSFFPLSLNLNGNSTLKDMALDTDPVLPPQTPIQASSPQKSDINEAQSQLQTALDDEMRDS